MAYDLNGSTQAFRVENLANKPTATCMVSAWVYADTLTTWATIVKNWGDSSLNGFVHLGMQAGDGDLSVYFVESDGTTLGPCRESSAFPTGSWQHVGFRADGSNGRLYRGGSEVGTTAPAYDGTLQSSSAPALGIGSKPTDAGTGFASTNAGWWDGRMAEVAVWSVDHGDAAMAALGKGVSPRYYQRGLIFYLPLVRRVQDEARANAMVTAASPSVAVHPRIIYPKKRVLAALTGGAAPPSGFNAWFAAGSNVILGAGRVA